MSQPEDSATVHSVKPPSYEDVVHGVTSEVTHSHASTTTPSPHYAPSHLPSAQNSSQLQDPHYLAQQPHLPRLYSVCPPGAELLCDLSEILVYSSQGRVYKIKDHNKVCIMTVKTKLEDDCCSCFTCDASTTFTLRTVDRQIEPAFAIMMLDSVECCSYDKRHLEVSAPPGAPVGTVRVASSHKCTVENQSGDVLYKLTREKSFFKVFPYQIFTPDGREVGRIDNSRGAKNRLMLPRDMPVQHKILFLFFAVFLQSVDDAARRNGNSTTSSSFT